MTNWHTIFFLSLTFYFAGCTQDVFDSRAHTDKLTSDSFSWLNKSPNFKVATFDLDSALEVDLKETDFYISRNDTSFKYDIQITEKWEIIDIFSAKETFVLLEIKHIDSGYRFILLCDFATLLHEKKYRDIGEVVTEIHTLRSYLPKGRYAVNMYHPNKGVESEWGKSFALLLGRIVESTGKNIALGADHQILHGNGKTTTDSVIVNAVKKNSLLTDGLFANSISPHDKNYSRWTMNWTARDSVQITFDLKKIENKIVGVVANCMGGNLWGIRFPTKVESYFSIDGIDFEKVGVYETHDLLQGEVLYTNPLTVESTEPLSAQFVRVNFVYDEPQGSHLFCDEVYIIQQ